MLDLSRKSTENLEKTKSEFEAIRTAYDKMASEEIDVSVQGEAEQQEEGSSRKTFIGTPLSDY